MVSIDLSIIVPVYNTEDYLIDCLESLLNQGSVSYEIIIINDGSTDKSGQISEKYARKYDFIKYIEQENQGLSATRNIGIKYARGEYIYFMDSDDILEESSLTGILKLLKRDSLDAIFFDGTSFSESNRKSEQDYDRKKTYGYFDTGQELFYSLVKNKVFYSSACLFIVRKAILLENELEFYKGIYHEDELFTVQLVMVIKNCMHINQKVFKRRIREGSIMTSGNILRRIKGYSIVFIELEMMMNEIEFINKKVKKAYKRNMGTIYRILINLYNNDPKVKVETSYISEIKRIAKEYNYFDFISMIATYNFKAYQRIKGIL